MADLDPSVARTIKGFPIAASVLVQVLRSGCSWPLYRLLRAPAGGQIADINRERKVAPIDYKELLRLDIRSAKPLLVGSIPTDAYSFV